MSIERRLRVFLCHSSKDKPLVRDTYKLLFSEQWIDPWFDEVSLKPGQDWKLEIGKTIDLSDVVIVFLSRNSVSKEGFVQKEIKSVLDKFDEKPAGSIYIIPIRVDDCEIPKRLAELHWIKISIENAEWYSPLIKSLMQKAKELGIPFKQDIEIKQFSNDKYNQLLSDFQELEVDLKRVQRALEIKEIEMKAVLAQAHEAVNTDSLTGISNHRKIMVDFQEEVIRATRYSNSLSIILLDLDQYNQIQESYDRNVGEDVLRKIAYRLRELIHLPSTIGRLEGGEFLIVLPACNISDAVKQAENLCETVRTKSIVTDELTIHVTASAGVVQFIRVQEGWEGILLRVDRALQKAKKNGRNSWATLEE